MLTGSSVEATLRAKISAPHSKMPPIKPLRSMVWIRFSFVINRAVCGARSPMKLISPVKLIIDATVRVAVNNIIKRVYSKDLTKINYEDYIIDTEKRTVTQNNKEINLTTLEFYLLHMFITNKNKSFSRDDILNIIWGENYFGTDRVVDDLIRRLRKKMPNLNINTMYGYGYRLT